MKKIMGLIIAIVLFAVLGLGTAFAATLQHVVEKSNTLWGISQKYYGTPLKWNKIAKDNGITNPKKLRVGTVLTITETEETTSVSDCSKTSDTPEVKAPVAIEKIEKKAEVTTKTADSYKATTVIPEKGYPLYRLQVIEEKDVKKDGAEMKNAARWFGRSKIDSMVGMKQNFGSGSTTSYRADITVYPYRWEAGDGLAGIGLGYKFNGWKGVEQSIGERHLGKLSFDWENRKYRFTLSALGGAMSERGRNWKNSYDLLGGGAYFRSHNEGPWFPKTELWGQMLNASGGNGLSELIDVGGRQFIYDAGAVKPYLEANLSLGLPKKHKNLGVQFGITDKKEIVYLSGGIGFNLLSGGAQGFADIGIDTSNLANALIKASEEDEVKEFAPMPADQETQKEKEKEVFHSPM